MMAKEKLRERAEALTQKQAAAEGRADVPGGRTVSLVEAMRELG